MRRWRRDDGDVHRESNESCCIRTCEYEENEEVMIFPCGDMFHKGLLFSLFVIVRVCERVAEDEMDVSLL